MRPFDQIASLIGEGGVFAWRKQLAKVAGKLEALSGIEIEGWAVERVHGGLQLRQAGQRDESAWTITRSEAGYEVGPGCVMVAGLTDVVILSGYVRAVSRGFICVQVEALPVMVAGSYASGQNNGLTGEVEVYGEPRLVFEPGNDGTTGTACEVDLFTVTAYSGQVLVPLAYVDPLERVIVRFIRKGIIISFLGTTRSDWMGVDFNVKQV